MFLRQAESFTLDLNMINGLESIVREIDDKVNAESVTSHNRETLEYTSSQHDFHTKQRTPKPRAHPSLAHRMNERLQKYKVRQLHINF